MSAPATSPALEVIRASTAAAHRALESTLAIARPGAGEAVYVRYLEALLGWLEPIETPLWSGAWPSQVAPADRCGKTAWIEADLRARGRDDRQLAALPRQRCLPPLDSLAQRFGVAYVVEGAQLGGQLLLRRLSQSLAPLPTRWLQGYGPESAGKWSAFLGALGASLESRMQIQSAADSARAAFELVQAWFVQRGVA